MRALILLVGCIWLYGCALPKGESTIDKAADAWQAKKNQIPKNFPTEDDLGVRYYPGCDYDQVLHTDEFGSPLNGVVIATDDSPEKVRDFYEKELGAKAMPTVPPEYSIQCIRNGKHYEVDYGPSGVDTTISIKITPAG